MAGRAEEGDFDPSLSCSDVADLRFHIPIQHTSVKFYASERMKDALYLRVEFVSVSDFGDGADNMVCPSLRVDARHEVSCPL